ncbi:antitoxin Xre/MbcA/ParS toxin-binding domain-containing protein [Aquisalimonas sp.]|uniref:type II RES/Xre toxin-antitoxin system antitoxin n=1 Tax=Aquisalimonas sp. TaxID=1872621 RepID=UPI0025BCF62F|nr:antitoxin Xre/MbcA/ParS toxin-binding domain-containing protein [Aquisalimonas sp.]
MTVAEKVSTVRHAGTGQHAKWLIYYLGENIFQRQARGGRKASRAIVTTVSGTELAGIVEAGLPVSAAEFLRQRTHMSVKRFGQFIPRSTLESKRKSAEQTLSAEQSDRIMRIAEIYARAAEVFGDSDRAERWMKRTNPQMPDGRTPEEMLLTSYGARHVDDVLTRLEHGIPA